jgi:hypothetical protein
MSQMTYMLLWNEHLPHVTAYFIFQISDAFCNILDQNYFIVYKKIHGVKPWHLWLLIRKMPYSYSKTNQMQNFRVYWISLYMFRTVFLSTTRSPRLYIQRQVYIIQVSWLLASGHETSISCPLASSQLTCMTYTWRWMYSLGLLMMDRKTVRNM